MKFILPKNHGIINYLLAVILLASPSLFGFTGLLAIFTYAIGTLHLVITLLTDYSVGLVKVIPFHVQGSIEFLLGILLIALAYLLFTNNAEGKLYYIIFGTVILLTWLFTDYKSKYELAI
ncbi:MAG: hypothetical protein JWP44_115 [Mucilaginibacter sp.]|nr:hypothetical protein [Mucilaginibacter sp.]